LCLRILPAKTQEGTTKRTKNALKEGHVQGSRSPGEDVDVVLDGETREKKQWRPVWTDGPEWSHGAPDVGKGRLARKRGKETKPVKKRHLWTSCIMKQERWGGECAKKGKNRKFTARGQNERGGGGS